jgi:flagellar FliL protein
MAHASPGNEDAGKPSRMKLPIPALLIVVILGVWLGVAGVTGVLYFLARSGKLSLGAFADNTHSSISETRHSMVLEPILVNLADEGGHAYLRVGLTLDVGGQGAAAPVAPEAGAANAKVGPENAVRDIVLTVLGRQTSASLLAPDGKEHLKIELREAITKSDLKIDVRDLYFSDFLVQS